jgi:hypothetical protein
MEKRTDPLGYYKSLPEGPYKDGYRRGYLDKLIGIVLRTGLSCPENEYAKGYKEGLNDGTTWEK